MQPHHLASDVMCAAVVAWLVQCLARLALGMGDFSVLGSLALFSLCLTRVLQMQYDRELWHPARPPPSATG